MYVSSHRCSSWRSRNFGKSDLEPDRSLHEYSDRALFDEKNFQSRNTDDVLWKSLFPGMHSLS